MDNNKYKELIDYLSEKYDEWKDEDSLSEDIWKKFSELGLIGLARQKEDGLEKFSNLISELFQFKKIGLIAAYAINEILINMINMFADKIDSQILNDINTGKKKVALCITEDHAGSDMSAISTMAEENENCFILNGKKVLVSNGPVADYYVVAAKTNVNGPAWAGISVFLVERDVAGFNISPSIEKAGIKLMPVGELFFENVHISKECLLGRKNRGFQYLVNALQFERTIISVIATRISEEIYKEICIFIKDRTVFDKKLKDYQVTKFEMAKYYSRLKLLKCFMAEIIKETSLGEFDKHNVMIAKIESTQLLKDLSMYYIQILGGKGFLGTHWAYNLFNDVRWTGLAGGSNELLWDVLGNNIVNQK